MRHCAHCNLDYKGELDRCALCGAKLAGEAEPSDFPVRAWHRLSRTVHRALGALIVVGVIITAVLCAIFGVPGVLIALAAGLVVYTFAKLMLTQGPLGTKLAKFFSMR